jgi:hypothetical protein
MLIDRIMSWRWSNVTSALVPRSATVFGIRGWYIYAAKPARHRDSPPEREFAAMTDLTDEYIFEDPSRHRRSPPEPHGEVQLCLLRNARVWAGAR